MTPPVRVSILIALLLSALLVPASAVALDRTVSVQATVEREVPNDSAEVHFAVSKERRGRAGALHIVAVRLRAVIAAAQGIPGVGPGDITTGSISVRRVERGERPVYRASEGVTVDHPPSRGRRRPRLAGVAAGATSTRGPNFFVGDREAAYDAALIEAVKRAKAKAEALATAAGATLGPAITITESGDVVPVVGPREPKSADECAPAPVRKGPVRRKAAAGASACASPTPPPVQPGNSTVKATVNAVFALQ